MGVGIVVALGKCKGVSKSKYDDYDDYHMDTKGKVPSYPEGLPQCSGCLKLRREVAQLQEDNTHLKEQLEDLRERMVKMDEEKEFGKSMI